MTRTELNKLPADQQQNALLAIALGWQIAMESDMLYVLKDSILDESDSFDYGDQVLLSSWQPQHDKALMWDLVCTLRDCLRADFGYRLRCEFLVQALDAAQTLIAAYISADPLGNIKKWKAENEPHTN